MNHPADDRLQDYIDDLLCREERTEVEQHLVQCPACTTHVRAERELRAALRSLPRSIDPPAHVLADIHAQLDAEAASHPDLDAARATYGSAPGTGTAAPRTGRAAPRTGRAAPRTGRAAPRTLGAANLARLLPLAIRAAPLAAAALVLVVVTALATWYLQTRHSTERTAAAERDVSGVVWQVLAAERPYLAAAAELEAVLAGAGDQLAPETRALLQHNLGVIDRALAESRAALDGEPDNVVLAELLRAAHEQKLSLLRRATRATGGA